MAAGRYFRFLVQAYFSQPQQEREIYRWIRANAPVLRIAEIGMGKAQRAGKLVRFAKLYAEQGQVEYLGIDMFEGRDDQSGLPLKTAYTQLQALGAKVKLVPGDAAMALPRVANHFRGVDLMLISADQDPAAVELALSWIPRMLHEKSLVLWEKKAPQSGRLDFDRLTLVDITRRAGGSAARAA